MAGREWPYLFQKQDFLISLLPKQLGKTLTFTRYQVVTTFAWICSRHSKVTIIPFPFCFGKQINAVFLNSIYCMDLLYHADLQYNIMQWTDEEKGAKPSALTRGWGRPGRMQHLQLHTLQIFLCRHWFLHVCTHCTIHTAAFSCASGWWRWRPLCTYVG